MWAASGAFRNNKVLARNKRYWKIFKLHVHSSLPGFRKFQARNTHQDIYSHWGNAHLVKIAFLGKIRFGQSFKGSAKLTERLVNCCGVCRICAYSEVQVFGKTGFGVLDNCVTANTKYLTPLLLKSLKRSLKSELTNI